MAIKQKNSILKKAITIPFVVTLGFGIYSLINSFEKLDKQTNNAISSYFGSPDRARITQAQTEMTHYLRNGVALFFLEHNRYPKSLTELSGFMHKAIPLDPFYNPNNSNKMHTYGYSIEKDENLERVVMYSFGIDRDDDKGKKQLDIKAYLENPKENTDGDIIISWP